LRRPHWLRAGQALVVAAETGKPRDVEWAFESIVAALDEEGWLPQGASRVPPPRSGPLHFYPPRFDLPRFDPPHFDPLRFESLRRVRPSVGNVTPRRPAEPLWRRVQPYTAHRPVLSRRNLRQVARGTTLLRPWSPFCLLESINRWSFAQAYQSSLAAFHL